jgi:hypothetical protein
MTVATCCNDNFVPATAFSIMHSHIVTDLDSVLVRYLPSSSSILFTLVFRNHTLFIILFVGMVPKPYLVDLLFGFSFFFLSLKKVIEYNCFCGTSSSVFGPAAITMSSCCCCCCCCCCFCEPYNIQKVVGALIWYGFETLPSSARTDMVWFRNLTFPGAN